MSYKKTKYLTTNEEDLKTAAELLDAGKTVIFPTETVYGLGANALDEKAAEKIFSAKGRPSDNPLIVHIGDIADLEPLVQEIPEIAKKLIDKFWPGPLTLIFKKSAIVPKAVTGGLDTVAVRMPGHEVASKLLKICRVPVAAPSANLSGKPSPTSFRHVKDDMDGRVDAVINGGDCNVGVESTVLDLSGEKPVLYRPGGVTAEEIEELIGEISIKTKAKEGESPKSPGLKYKHYAPNAEVIILSGDTDKVFEYIKEQAVTKKVGVLSFDELLISGDNIVVRSLGSNKKPEESAHRLFTALRELDEEGADIIFAPEIPDSGMWRAVRNRLYRAAGEKILDIAHADKKHVLAVCTGNTCRSPMAEALIRERFNELGISAQVSSAGIFADGSFVSDNSRIVMKELGIDISEHKSRQITKEIVEKADMIITMTSSHKQMILSVLPDAKEKIYTLAEAAGEECDVIDPYGGDLNEYRKCRDNISTLVKKCLWSEL